MSRHADWSALPSELLRSISKKLPLVFDFIHFRSVCTSWRSAASPSDLPPQLPWLMLPPGLPENWLDRQAPEFFGLADLKLHKLRLPDVRNRVCYSAGHGWLLLVGIPEMLLLNPLTRRLIPLPAIFHERKARSTFVSTVLISSVGPGPLRSRSERRDGATKEMRRWLLDRALLSSNPATSADWALIVSLNKSWELAIYKAGDNAWSVLGGCSYRLHSIARLNGTFYALSYPAKLFAIDIRVKGMERQPRGHHKYGYFSQCYLVPSAGELLLVKRKEVGGIGEKKEKESFDVFRMDLAGAKPRWSKVDSLRDRALFLSRSNNLSVSVADLPGWCRPNCIYYCDFPGQVDRGLDGNSIGVFSLEDNSVSLIRYCLDDSPKWWKASWILPSIC